MENYAFQSEKVVSREKLATSLISGPRWVSKKRGDCIHYIKEPLYFRLPDPIFNINNYNNNYL